MIIRADYRQIDKRLCELSVVLKAMKNELEEMDDSIQNLGIFWESEAGCEYALRITADMVTIAALAEKTGQNINLMREAVGRLDSAEKQVGILMEG